METDEPDTRTSGRVAAVQRLAIGRQGALRAFQVLPNSAIAIARSAIRDTVDTHLGRIAVASLLSGALSVAANEAEDDDTNRLTESVTAAGAVLEEESTDRATSAACLREDNANCSFQSECSNE